MMMSVPPYRNFWRDFPIGCGPDNRPSKKVDGFDSEVEIEPKYVDFDSDLEEEFNANLEHNHDHDHDCSSDFPIDCDRDDNLGEKIDGSDSEIETEPKYVDFESDLEDGFDCNLGNNHDHVHIPIGCGPDPNNYKKVDGSDSEIEIEPKYVDFESDLEDVLDEGDENFKEFLKDYQNPKLEGFGDSDDVDGTGFAEIKKELESMKKDSAFFDYFECNVVGESRQLQEEEEVEEADYIYDDAGESFKSYSDYYYVYDAFGNVVDWKSKRGVPSSKEYDDDAELFDSCSGSSYEYDASGRVVGMKSKKRAKLESNPVSSYNYFDAELLFKS